MSSRKAELRIDWADARAAKYACEQWHYSGPLPPGTANFVGAWEDGAFIGVVVFSRGAAWNLGARYNLQQTECCELTRVALRAHVTPVSRVVKVALLFLHRRSPGVRLVVSFADANVGHHGGIYQAGGWIYTGRSAREQFYEDSSGRVWHRRDVTNSGVVMCFGQRKRGIRRSECTPVLREGKHRYLMPLDAEMRAQVEHLAEPYPKRIEAAPQGIVQDGRVGSAGSGTPGTQPGGGGAAPTSALHPRKATRRGS